MNKKVNIITLGCSKNTVDSEHIAAQLAAAGWDVEFDGGSTDGGVVIVNTCGFIGDAKQESIDMILQCAAARTAGAIDRLYVFGCLSQRYGDELTEEIPEVDAFFGVRDLGEVTAALGVAWDDSLNTVRSLSTPGHYAYLKISEGCDRRCGFCAIPLIRGRHISVPMEELEAEARMLAGRGVKELIVIAQDTTCYGLDIYGRRALAELLGRLCRVDGIEWIRLHYAYPEGFTDEVIEVMAREPKICEYLDIPLQHISDSQLRAMRRGNDKAGTVELIRKLRERMPGIAIRTTMLVGYPGETEEDFRQLEEFIREARFERLGVFPYSEEEGTYSATRLKDDVPEEEKQRRADHLMAVQAGISYEKNRALEGSELEVIADRAEDGFVVARSRHDSPEVDQEILIPSELFATLPAPGEIFTVRITGAQEYDLYAEPV